MQRFTNIYPATECRFVEAGPENGWRCPTLSGFGRVRFNAGRADAERLIRFPEIEAVVSEDRRPGQETRFSARSQDAAQAVVVHTEVSLMPAYENQPSFGDVDTELRSQGFGYQHDRSD